MTSAANGSAPRALELEEGEAPDDIAVIRRQTFETLQILRNLIALLMPKEDDDGPKLVDLIAALVAQQRDIATGIIRLQSDLNALFDFLNEADERQARPGQSG